MMLETVMFVSKEPELLRNLIAVAPVKLLPVIVKVMVEPMVALAGESEEMTGPLVTDTAEFCAGAVRGLGPY